MICYLRHEIKKLDNFSHNPVNHSELAKSKRDSPQKYYLMYKVSI